MAHPNTQCNRVLDWKPGSDALMLGYPGGFWLARAGASLPGEGAGDGAQGLPGLSPQLGGDSPLQAVHSLALERCLVPVLKEGMLLIPCTGSRLLEAVRLFSFQNLSETQFIQTLRQWLPVTDYSRLTVCAQPRQLTYFHWSVNVNKHVM